MFPFNNTIKMFRRLLRPTFFAKIPKLTRTCSTATVRQAVRRLITPKVAGGAVLCITAPTLLTSRSKRDKWTKETLDKLKDKKYIVDLLKAKKYDEFKDLVLCIKQYYNTKVYRPWSDPFSLQHSYLSTKHEKELTDYLSTIYVYGDNQNHMQNFKKQVLKHGDVKMLQILEENQLPIDFSNKSIIKIVNKKDDLDLFKYVMTRPSCNNSKHYYMTNAKYYSWLVEQNLLEDAIKNVKTWDLLHKAVKVDHSFPEEKFWELVNFIISKKKPQDPKITGDLFKDMRDSFEEGYFHCMLTTVGLPNYTDINELSFIYFCSPTVLKYAKEKIKASPDYDKIVEAVDKIANTKQVYPEYMGEYGNSYGEEKMLVFYTYYKIPFYADPKMWQDKLEILKN